MRRLFRLKMHQNRLAAGLRPAPLEELKAFTILRLREKRRREKRKIRVSKRRNWKERREWGKGRWGEEKKGKKKGLIFLISEGYRRPCWRLCLSVWTCFFATIKIDGIATQ